MNLPSVYQDFYQSCLRSTPAALQGSDLAKDEDELKGFARELLEADEVPHLLTDNDFVFMMHQGYLFWFFKLDGDPDPVVYGYQEGDKHLKQFDRFTMFIHRCKTEAVQQ